MPVRDAVSAGGIVWRREGDVVEVVICGRNGDRTWGLPKGTPDPGETLEQTARREVEEETGLEVSIGQRVGAIDYWFVAGGYRIHKYVHHWLMEPTGGSLEDHDIEFDVVRWVPVDEAMTLLTYKGERQLLASAARLLGDSA